jgi:DNA-binding CsgD family transcriptional regulator
VGEGARASGHDIVGREAELAVLQEFLGLDGGGRALVVTGDAGIGKTTMWEAGLGLARERGFRVLSSRASGAEAQLSFTALIDLLDGVGEEELARLPGLQRRALEVAVLRAEPDGAEPDPRAIALGFLNALRVLAADRPLLVAVDDFPWLDAPSAEALAFAARRLESDPIVFLLARRPGPPSVVEQALATRPPDRLEVGPLSYGATRRLLSERLGLALPRHVLRRLVDTTLGNPLFALELGRELDERGLPAIGEDLPVPDAIEELLGTRVGRLPVEIRRLLLATALSARLTTAQLCELSGTRAVEDAIDAGVLVTDGDGARAAHPLLAAAAMKRSRAGERRELHAELAGVVDDEELRARHLALGAEHSDEELAAAVATAAASASARGARQDAVELSTEALRLTPSGSLARTDRVLELAGYLELVGEPQRVVDLLEPELEALPEGDARVRGLLLFIESALRCGRDVRGPLERALAESGDDPRLRAHVLPAMTVILGTNPVERTRDAEAWAAEALPAARAVGPDAERLALDALEWIRGLRGAPIESISEHHSAAAGYIATSGERVTAQRLAWRGEVERARDLHSRLLSLADDRDEALSYALERLHLCELELRAGECEAASRLLDEWNESLDRELLPAPMYERCCALLAAVRGRADEAEKRAARVMEVEDASAQRSRWNWLEALRARGIAALHAHDPGRAAESVRTVWQHTQREGADDPGVFPVAPELVEALVELDELDEARAVTDRLRELAEQQEHPWGLATAKRCAGLVSLTDPSYDEEAAAALSEAAGEYAELGLRFDAARTLLVLGRAQRRHRKWAAARASLERAVSAFDEIGSPGWVEEARSELARVGARRPQSEGELSPAERRVAELAAEGLSNKQIAQALHVTVKTVEAHLSHAYAKLGVRSRSQLAARLPDLG